MNKQNTNNMVGRYPRQNAVKSLLKKGSLVRDNPTALQGSSWAATDLATRIDDPLIRALNPHEPLNTIAAGWYEEGVRIICPLVDGRGNVRSVCGLDFERSEYFTPDGYRTSGLVVATSKAIDLLRSGAGDLLLAPNGDLFLMTCWDAVVWVLPTTEGISFFREPSSSVFASADFPHGSGYQWTKRAIAHVSLSHDRKSVEVESTGCTVS